MYDAAHWTGESAVLRPRRARPSAPTSTSSCPPTACPSCSRQNFDVVSTMSALEGRLEDIRTPLDVAVIGCIVNGPGEAREADIGLTGGTPNNLVYVDGAPDHKVKNPELLDDLEALIRQKAAARQQQLEQQTDPQTESPLDPPLDSQQHNTRSADLIASQA